MRSIALAVCVRRLSIRSDRACCSIGAELRHVADHGDVLAGRRDADGGGAGAGVSAGRRGAGAWGDAAGLERRAGAGAARRISSGTSIVWISLGAVLGIDRRRAVRHSCCRSICSRSSSAVFVLITTWLPQPKIVGENRVVQFIGGAVISALSMVVGADGAAGRDVHQGAGGPPATGRHARDADDGAESASRSSTFTALGFAFAAYLPLIVAMIVAGLRRHGSRQPAFC